MALRDTAICSMAETRNETFESLVKGPILLHHREVLLATSCRELEAVQRGDTSLNELQNFSNQPSTEAPERN